MLLVLREDLMSTAETTQRAEPFEIAVPQEKIDRILRRVRTFDWDVMPALEGWALGTDHTFLRDLCTYWVEQYDWRRAERAMNVFAHVRADVGSVRLHALRERGSGKAPQPLLLLHGWPYSFASFLGVVEQLAHPERFGGDAEDGFDVVVASLPGYGFSGKPAAPMGPQAMGDLLDALMTDVLGYGRYLVQGGDFGGFIASRLGFDHAAHLLGVHSNSFMVRHDGAMLGSGQAGPGKTTDDERAFVQAEAQGFMAEGGYAVIQGTRPQSLGAAMQDSPVGAAAWIVETFHAWSDRRERAFPEIFTPDQLLTEVMIYLVTDTFTTATWIYPAYFVEGSATLPAGKRVEAPTAFAAYPDPVFAAPPRSFMERSHHVAQWSQMPRGGHFPALEVPDLYVRDVQQFGRLLRRDP